MPQDLGATEKELIENRKSKISDLIKLGVDPFPSETGRNTTAAEIIDQQDTLIKSEKEVTAAGRIMARRGHGKLCFVDLVDESGKIQAVLRADFLPEKDLEVVALLDAGDFLEVTGKVFVTKAGELSIEAHAAKILTKSIRPLPEQWFGLKDVETRYRERYVDLIVNSEVKEKFYIRSKVIQSLREFLIGQGFMEVDTPVLQPIPGGASAKPFQTHYNAYETDVFLRIAPELYLKRLVVGGFEKVFEFARSFRNEGVDATHNPEFTNLEFYWAYADYEKLMNLTEEMIRSVVKSINGGKLEMELDGKQIDFGQKFTRVTFDELTHGQNTDAAFKEGVAKIVAPTFVTNHPTELIPLAKRNAKNPEVVDTFQLVINGLEMAKAFSELNDPVDQRNRFEAQMKLREKGDQEAQLIDEDFLKAIEYGMPPTAGFGIGVDRFVRLLTNSKTLREILFFPFMK
ncbi:MAG: lysine--tRNA ligase [Patescibacteria group bacterium]|jgi:lysyl-tRNA synthetase class 2